MKVYWCRADELRDECESGADTTVVEYVEANAEVCQLRADCDQHEDRIAQLNEILHGERSEIALLRDATAILERSLSDQVRENERLREAIIEYSDTCDDYEHIEPGRDNESGTDFAKREMALAIKLDALRGKLRKIALEGR